MKETLNTKSIINKLQKLFNTHVDDICRDDKLQLLTIIFITCFHKLSHETCYEIMELAKISKNDRKLLSCIESIIKTQKTNRSTSQIYIDYLIRSLYQSQLSKEEYPYINKLPPNSEEFAKNPHHTTSSQPLRLVHTRHARKSTSYNAGKDEETETQCPTTFNSLSGISQKQCPRKTMVIFLVGGMSNSEIAIVEKLSVELKCQVILGSTHLVNPCEFLTALQSGVCTQ